MRISVLILSLIAVYGVALVGCGGKGGTNNPTANTAYLLTSEPAKAQSVDAVRAEAKDGDTVVIVGKIGGDVKPFVEGTAAFQIVDLARKSCSDRPGDDCKTPWDYCCETDLNTSMAVIQIVDAQGTPVAKDAKQLLNVKELDTVVVQGKAQRQKDNLTILAEKVFVRK